MDKLDKAIADFEDENLDLTLGERVSQLRDALMWNAFKAMQKIKKNGASSPISQEEEYKHTECMRYFKELEKMYISEIKFNKATGAPPDHVGYDFIRKIKEMKSSIGDIVQGTQ